MIMSKKYRRRYNPEKIKKRDKYACVYCGSETKLTVDHIIPISQAELYGLKRAQLNVDSNLVTACEPCNQEKKNLSIDDFLNRTPERRRVFLQRARYLNNYIKDFLS